MEKNNVIANASKGYGYNYASLADIRAQGYPIPKMKTVTEDGRDFLYYYDSEVKEWLRGAEIVLPESRGMNKAQLYGSALTYARRYTTLMADQLACTDDQIIEDIDDKGESKKTNAKKKEQADALTEFQNQHIDDLRKQMFADAKEKLTKAEVDWLMKKNNLVSEADITEGMISVLRKLQMEKKNAQG